MLAAAGAGGGAGALLTSCGGADRNPEVTQTVGPDQARADAAVTNALLDLERMAVIAYELAGRRLSGPARAATRPFLDHEREHQRTMESAIRDLGAHPVPPRPPAVPGPRARAPADHGVGPPRPRRPPGAAPPPRVIRPGLPAAANRAGRPALRARRGEHAGGGLRRLARLSRHSRAARDRARDPGRGGPAHVGDPRRAARATGGALARDREFAHVRTRREALALAAA